MTKRDTLNGPLSCKSGEDEGRFIEHYKVVASLAFEEPVLDIPLMITRSNIDISEEIPALGTTLIHALAQRFSENAHFVVRYLFESGLLTEEAVNVVDSSCLTPPMLAYLHNNISTCQLFLEVGADLSISEQNGDTLLHLAVQNNDIEIIDLILQHDPPLDARNNRGATPKHLANEYGYTEAYQMLEDAEKSSCEITEDSGSEQIVAYDFENVQEALSNVLGDMQSTQKVYYQKMLSLGPNRKLMGLTHKQVCDVKNLSEKFPNFIEVIEHIYRELSLSLLSPSPIVTFKPILLYGDPGVGKTRFAKELSKILELPIQSMDGGSISSKMSISGGSASYKDAGPGAISSFVINNEFANGIVFFDEVDKMASGGSKSLFGPLHKLLVPEMSGDFVDEYLSVPMNLSKLNWIATANDMDVIPKSIVSRFREFNVPLPTDEQRKIIIKSILDDIGKNPEYKWTSAFDMSLPANIETKLVAESVRDIESIIYNAFAKAAGRALDKKPKRKLKLSENDFVFTKKKEKVPIGFVS